MEIHTLILLICMITAPVMAWAAFEKQAKPRITASIVLAGAIVVEGLAYLLYPSGTFSLQFLTAAYYLFSSLAASTQLLLAFHYTQRSAWISLRTLSGLLIQPVLLQLFFWMSPLNKIFFRPPGWIGDRVNTAYILLMLIASLVLLADTSRRIPPEPLRRRRLILAAACIPLIVNLVLAFNADLILRITLSVLSYTLFLIGTGGGRVDIHQSDRKSVTREAVVEAMDDGWMVVDSQNQIVDLNHATEVMIGQPREKLYGQPVTTALPYLADFFKSAELVKELNIRRSVKTQNEWRYINIHVSKLSDDRNVQFGHLIMWRDITKRKMADDARQHARDELFVLLSAISSAASQSMNLDEFLSESINQIIYSFKSQGVGVYLLEDNKLDGGQNKLKLKSHFGILPEQVRGISNESLTSSLMQWLRDEQEKDNFTVLDLHGGDLGAFPIIHEMGFSRVALIPLYVITQKKSEILGCLCLARTDDIPFTQDEMIRLKAISNQIAALIDSDRRREYAIAVSERQRLMRDLHDSVSQKLYGLVALTEAAQAGMEAGSQIAPLQVLTRIGENARQAVKEMRLFLYEMQPVDLEEGLITVLHHRLAAVEGRADIKARLLVDDNLVLSKDKEIALYFITQEALNNILRHAHAKNISLTLKQSGQNVILEVEDDGRGFDMDTVDEDGLGLRNMRERSEKLDGKFTIASEPGRGTKITILIPKNDQEQSQS